MAFWDGFATAGGCQAILDASGGHQEGHQLLGAIVCVSCM